MKKTIYILCTLVLASFLSGCISRTISTDSQNRSAEEEIYGSKQNGTVLEKKIIWFWQDDFSQP